MGSSTQKIGNPHLEKSFGKKPDVQRLNEIIGKIKDNTGTVQQPSKKP